jgi:hypothetical protein
MKLFNSKSYLVFLIVLSIFQSSLVLSLTKLGKIKDDQNVPIAQKIDKELLTTKSTFKLFQALRFLAIGSGVFKPMEFFYNRMSLQLDSQDKDDSNAKCGRKAIKQNYENIIKESIVKIQDEKLSQPYEERLKMLVSRCNKFVENTSLIKDLLNKAKTEKPSKLEIKESMLKSVNDAKECLADFKKILFEKSADLSMVKPPCQLILGNLGCNTKDLSLLKECLQGKKDKDGKAIVDSPIDITEKLASIQINTTKEHPHPLISDLEKNPPTNCKVLKGIVIAEKGKVISPFKKFVCRIKGLLVTFNDILKCKGVHKPYMEVFNSIDLGSFMQMIINMLTLDNLPKTNRRLLVYVSEFVNQTLHYFNKKKMLAKIKKKDNRLKIYIMMSRHFGAAIGNLIRTFFILFKTNWISTFRSTKPGEIVKVEDTVVGGVKIFDDFNLRTSNR